MSNPLIPVILAGGKGERFWPLSRLNKPKQFLCLDGSDKSLLQATADRLLPLAGGWENLWIITSALIADGVRQQLPNLPEKNLLIEPEGKDTAPAIAWATLTIAEIYGSDAIIGFFPADHWIGEQNIFTYTLKIASDVAQQKEAIVTLGITPTYAATGYGYIEQGINEGSFQDLSVYRVNRFTEKPDHTTAESFIKTGKFSWNSGMFIFRARVGLNELKTYAPQIIEPLITKGKEAYLQLEKKSIDYALMEKTQLAYVLPVNFNWDDLGDWNALARLNKDGDNVTLANHIGKDTHGTIIYNSDDQELIVTIGLDDIVIVRDRNITLVVKKDSTQDIKEVLKLLKADAKYQDLL